MEVLMMGQARLEARLVNLLLKLAYLEGSLLLKSPLVEEIEVVAEVKAEVEQVEEETVDQETAVGEEAGPLVITMQPPVQLHHLRLGDRTEMRIQVETT